MKKKFLSLTLVSLMLFSLAGCGKNAEFVTEAPKETTDDGIYFAADMAEEEAKASATQNSRAYLSFDYNSLSEEEYESIEESGFKNPVTSPLSTFSSDVDTASYSNIRRFIMDGTLPPSDAVRTEEIINYFDYDLPTPSDGTPFSVTAELNKCPWNESNLLLMLAIKGEDLSENKKTPQNLVFLIDTSGSMHQDNRLPLVQKSFEILLDELAPSDTVTIITYAGSSGYALKPTKVKDKEKIIDAVNSLKAYGSTNGEAGIRLAYDAALDNKVEGNNRIILCTDGDFNVGMSDNESLEKLIEEKRELGIYLTVLGFGMGNYKDSRMETLADKGNGNYAYIDSLMEAKRVLSDRLTGTLYTIADDVKFQAEFNPKMVKSYRLLGYENRHLETEDFENDKKDAGEVGCGHTLVVLYEIEPGDATENAQLKYQSVKHKGDLLTFRIRYKSPGEDDSKLIEYVIDKPGKSVISENFALAASAAELSLLLKNSEFKADASFESVIKNAEKASKGNDPFGIRAEFKQMASLAKILYKSYQNK